MSKSQICLAVPGVRSLHPYQPGKPIEELERELGILSSLKLASNENPLGPSAIALKAAMEALSEMALYPDATAYNLKLRLEQEYRIKPSCITAGNGSNDLIELIGRVFLQPGDEVIFSEFAFIVYPIVAQACCALGTAVPAKDYAHDLEAIAAKISLKTKLIYLANPNNPTGTAFSQSEFEQLMSVVPETVLVVLDEAYTEYIEDDSVPNGLELVGRYSNLIVIRTFSKAWGLAGLRMGFAVASEQITDLLNRVRQPFNVNVAALAAATAVLDDKDYLKRSIETNTQGMRQLELGFKQLGINYIPSRANFLTIDLERPAKAIYEGMLREGVIVRPLGIYNMPNHLRVSIGTQAENDRALDALQRTMGQ